MDARRLALLSALAVAACAPASDAASDARGVRAMLAAPGVRLVPAEPAIPAAEVGSEWAEAYRVAGHPVLAVVYGFPDAAAADRATGRPARSAPGRWEGAGGQARGPLALVTVRGEIDMAGGDPETTRQRDAVVAAFERAEPAPGR